MHLITELKSSIKTRGLINLKSKATTKNVIKIGSFNLAGRANMQDQLARKLARFTSFFIGRQRKT